MNRAPETKDGYIYMHKPNPKPYRTPPPNPGLELVTEWDQDWDVSAKCSGLIPTGPSACQFRGPLVVEFGRAMEDISLMLEDAACPVPFREVLNAPSVRESTREGTIIEWCLMYLVGKSYVQHDHEPGFGATYCGVKPFRIRPRLLQGGFSHAGSTSTPSTHPVTDAG